MSMTEEPMVETPAATALTPEEKSARDQREREDHELIKQFEREIDATKRRDQSAFKRMKEDMDFAFKYGSGAQWPGQTEHDSRYSANIVQRHIQTRVAALYAKNPTVVAKRRQRREHIVWDGDIESLVAAHARVQEAAVAQEDPHELVDQIEIIQDFNQGFEAKKQSKAIGETLEILFSYQMDEQQPNFKRAMKQFVRRTQTCGLAWLRLGYQRQMGRRRADQSYIDDCTAQLQRVERLQSELLDKEGEDAKDLETKASELRNTLENLQSKPETILREGLTFNFPKTPRILVDKRCTDLLTLTGAGWIAEEIPYTPEQVLEVYGVNVRESYSPSDDPSSENDGEVKSDETKTEKECLVYHYYHKANSLEYIFCKGFKKFLKKPEAPVVKVERFFPFYPLAFNAVEHDEERYPPSDVRLLRPIQIEYNRLKEALRQHRIASRPVYVTPAGAFEESDIKDSNQPSLSNYEDHEVIVLNGLKEGQSIDTLLQPVQKVNIDPNLYETAGTIADMERVVGTQEANLGGTSGATATESSIAESGRLSSLASNVDDLDDLLAAVARDGGAVLLSEMDAVTVAEIVGPGAVWPELSREQIVKEVYLKIEAGSSGRPNRAQEIANFERAAPFLVQIPGITPDWIGRTAVRIIDDKIDLAEAISEGLPSIVAMNQAAQPSTGDNQTDPAQQGSEGSQNQPEAAETRPGAQPAFPQSDR